MIFPTIILIALGLSFDTFAVSVSNGISISSIRFWEAVKVATIFALFQAFMPLIGWMVGIQIEQSISNYDHWVAFGLLTILAIKMILESFKKDPGHISTLKLTLILGMALATSIDALVAGVSFAFMEMNIYQSLLVIAIVTFLSSMMGTLFGKKVGSNFGKRMERIGGLILFGIGVKILNDHLA